jgi:hypothetical protein
MALSARRRDDKSNGQTAHRHKDNRITHWTLPTPTDENKRMT